MPEVSERSERLTLDVASLGLPVGLEPETIGLDIWATERAARLCDTSSLHIKGANFGEDEVEVGGNMQADGALAGAKAVTRKAFSEDSRSLSLNNKVAKSSESTLTLNSGFRKSAAPELADLYNLHFQSQLLDKQLHRGLRGIAWKNQIELDLRGLQMAACFLMDVSGISWVMGMVHSGELDPGQSANQLIMRGLVAGVYAVRAHSYGLEAKPSAVLSVHLDRYLVAAGYLATHRLVAPLQTV